MATTSSGAEMAALRRSGAGARTRPAGPSSSARPSSASAPPSPARRRLILPLCVLILCAVALVSMAAGRYWVPPNEILRILFNEVTALFGGEGIVRRTWTEQEATVVLDVRLPRVLLAFLVGGALSLGGACLQALFRNPLVSPDIIGVTAGASFGGVLVLTLGLSGGWMVGGAFGFGLAALAGVLLLGRLGGRDNAMLMIVLGGIVVAAFFNALVSFMTYLADPYSELPSIVHWLLGSIAAASYDKVLTALVPVAIGAAVVLALRWRLNVLSLGDDDAAALGVNPHRSRVVLLCAVALMTAGTVAVAGAVGWVGLVVPHLARLWVGPDHRTLLPASLLLGGTYLMLIDTISRSISSSELPLGILTAIIGAPVFVVLLARSQKKAELS
ncbi:MULTISPECIES: iron ABC transporter permease [unclassified Arthrobacter]|uniref:FecCD family ABC transporter permease n=1 Tax=unclassified Arthrobacter TaxID=235627 RepID=UPI001E500F20|nr:MULTISPECIES: iron ABC transporter permease [unclassified Arthrobacter]MCC9146744.1 iron ABC transporter permease [Arthrobacter sp. zg-Y919]MDK1277975.1 iron ABC transporter permease [Arthrobacter sp. zg.Y919]WIB03432.1 iron ABC transporter permease [Arthrobacter sp. zg-Y919]